MVYARVKVTSFACTIAELVRSGSKLDKDDIASILGSDDQVLIEQLYGLADQERAEHVGQEILLRGVIEFSNYCRNSCAYCGIGIHNRSLARYRLDANQVMDAVKRIVASGIRTVVLQSGEDPYLDPAWLASIIARIKSFAQVAVTLSVGEWQEHEYRLWRSAGADRYLLKIETTDPLIYSKLHPGMSLENRLRCLSLLQELGYQTGTGNLIGLPGQGPQQIAQDLLFFAKGQFDMLAIGPFIPHPDTPLARHPYSSIDLTVRAIAVARLLCKASNMPATTAVATVGGQQGRHLALKAGANVVMVNFTPAPYNTLYDIYPDRPCAEPIRVISRIQDWARANNRTVLFSVGNAKDKKV